MRPSPGASTRSGRDGSVQALRARRHGLHRHARVLAGARRIPARQRRGGLAGVHADGGGHLPLGRLVQRRREQPLRHRDVRRPGRDGGRDHVDPAATATAASAAPRAAAAPAPAAPRPPPVLPSMTTAASPGVELGGRITDTATITGRASGRGRDGGVPAVLARRHRVYRNPVFVSTVPVGAAGTATSSALHDDAGRRVPLARVLQRRCHDAGGQRGLQRAGRRRRR